MKLLKYSVLLYSLMVLITGGLSSCSKIDDYKQYLPEGEVRYAGRADSVISYPGENRILLSWLLIADPNINNCKVYWNNRGDSAEINVQKTSGIDTVFLMLDNMEERSYNFEIYTYDNEGNRSVAVYENGSVYGEKYQAALLPREVTQAWLREDTAVLDWSAADEQAIGVELEYATAPGGIRHLIILPTEGQSKLPDYKQGTSFKYRTLYMPDSMAIDTFYTPFQTKEVLHELDRTSWTVTGFSSEEATGEGADNGHAIHAIDNDNSTFWHTQWEGASPGPPHYIAFDMANEEMIHGFFFTPRQGSTSGNAKDIQIAVSVNGTDWEDAGVFILENNDNKHLIYLESPVPARYFKITVTSSHGDQNSTFFAEVGAFGM